MQMVKYVQYTRMDIEVFKELLSMVEPQYEQGIVGLVMLCRFQIPLHGPADFVSDAIWPMDKIRTCRDWTDMSTTKLWSGPLVSEVQ